MKTRDIVGLGCATLDELYFISAYPAPDSKTPVISSEKQGGGLTATALVAAARLGASCAYGGVLGYDEISQFVARNMETEGIDTSLVAWRDDAAAIRSIILVDVSNNTRSIFFERYGKVGAAPDTPTEAEIAASRVLLVDHYGESGNTRAIEIARRCGVPVVADFERTNVPEFETFFPLVDHLVLSRHFAAKLTGEAEPSAILKALWNDNRAVVVVTCGEEGSWSLENGEIRRTPAYPTRIVDTTGCGDVFHGIYAATLAWGWPLEKRLRWASAAASLKAQHIGAQKGIPRREAIEALVEAK